MLLDHLPRDVSDDETLLLAWLAERDIYSVVAVTKTDKLKPMRRAARLRELRSQLDLPAERVIATSAQTGEGIEGLWRTIHSQLFAARA